MPSVYYIQPDGVKKTAEVANGLNLMEAAISNNIDGIDGACGGSGMCATCHVYVDEDYRGKLDAIDDSEDEMLDNTSSERKPTSRLSCQIVMTDILEYIKLTIPPTQT